MPRPCPCRPVRLQISSHLVFLSEGPPQVQGSFKMLCCHCADIEQIHIASSMFGAELLKW